VSDSFELSPEAAPAPPDLKRTRRRKDAAIDLSKVDRLPPHSLEAEQSVLGGLLIDNAAWDKIIDIVKESDI